MIHKLFNRIPILLFILCVSLTSQGYSLSNPPTIVVSISPFSALVSNITEGVTTPMTLVPPQNSPHDYVLKPSDMRKIQKADLVIWGGPDLEPYLAKVIEQSTPSLRLDTVEGLHKIPIRSHDHHHDHHHGNWDVHFWLDPMNGIACAKAIVQALSTLDPVNQKTYQKNADKLIKRLHALDKDLSVLLKPVQDKPFIVFHDAYQYFDHRYHLNQVGTITLDPEFPPSAKHLQSIRELIQEKKVVCVFSEPQFPSKTLTTLIQDLNIENQTLDPLGTDLSAEGYPVLLEKLGHSINDCLGNSPLLKP